MTPASGCGRQAQVHVHGRAGNQGLRDAVVVDDLVWPRERGAQPPVRGLQPAEGEAAAAAVGSQVAEPRDHVGIRGAANQAQVQPQRAHHLGVGGERLRGVSQHLRLVALHLPRVEHAARHGQHGERDFARGWLGAEGVRVEGVLGTRGQEQPPGLGAGERPVLRRAPDPGPLEPVADGREPVDAVVYPLEVVVVPRQHLPLVARPGPGGLRWPDEEPCRRAQARPGLERPAHVQAWVPPMGAQADRHLDAIQCRAGRPLAVQGAVVSLIEGDGDEVGLHALSWVIGVT